jgi:hypothetical protein
MFLYIYTKSFFKGVIRKNNDIIINIIVPAHSLIPTNFAVFSRLGQVILAGTMLLGNGVLITLAPVVTRLYYWHKFPNQHTRSGTHFINASRHSNAFSTDGQP